MFTTLKPTVLKAGDRNIVAVVPPDPWASLLVR